ncbi:hypothetical protein RPHASCH2410_CH21150 [Rhizobium phaseoli Ch24-10]|nr:hypothetical protein RPHASCH2410_CH21150 [Rhizobium phaseoli Ch24-10]
MSASKRSRAATSPAKAIASSPGRSCQPDIDDARLSLLIHEFRRLSGRTITPHVGQILSWVSLSEGSNRKDLLARLHEPSFRWRRS